MKIKYQYHGKIICRRSSRSPQSPSSSSARSASIVFKPNNTLAASTVRIITVFKNPVTAEFICSEINRELVRFVSIGEYRVTFY